MTSIDTAYSISDLASATGLTTSTLRYYEQEGLMRDPIGRASSSHRRYSPEDARWIEFVGKLRTAGMPIRDIRRYATLAREGEHTTPARLELLRQHRERVLAELAALQESLTAIEFKIDSYERFSTK